MKLRGKTAIVTGGGRDIGRACAIRLAAEGARVAVNYFASSAGAEGARVATCDIDQAALASLPEDVVAGRVDVGDPGTPGSFIDGAIRGLGGLDCLVNSAGAAGPTVKVEDIDLADWERTLAICLTSQFIGVSHAVSALRESGNASIVNFSSVAGRDGFPLRSPYAAAKWGVVGLTKSLSIELGVDRIRVYAIMPGNLLRGR